MGDIGIIVNNTSIRDMALNVVKKSPLSISVVLARSFEDSVNQAVEMQSRGFRVLISRGGHSARIREAGLNIPIIDIPFMGNNIAALLIKAKKVYGEFAVVGNELLINTARELGEAIGSGIHYFRVKEWKDYETMTNQARLMNLEAIVGGYDATSFAEKIGLRSFCIETREFEINTAVQEAEKILSILDKERRWNELFRTILDSIREGIVSTASDGTVTHLNQTARKLLGVDGRLMLGKPVGIRWLRDQIEDTLKRGVKSYDNLYESDNSYTGSVLPIKVGEQISGSVVVLQEIEYVQQVERSIRRKLSQKGFIAKTTFDLVLGKSSILQANIKKAKQYSLVDSTILIRGESGTGKEMFAQSIHNFSLRREEAFVAINCATIPPNLLESEFFGYVDGAFTGAKKGGKAGLFELAHNGTIFLDEIGEIAVDMQARLLRVLEERQIRRVGGDKVIPVNIRVIAATNKDLARMVKEGNFREDLYYRLNVLSLNLPPLRERRADIPIMLNYFADFFTHSHNKHPIVFSEEGMELLAGYEWPGNIRELKNIVERLVITAQDESVGKMDVMSVLGDVSGILPVRSIDSGTESLLESNEKELITFILKETGGNKTEAAKKLGISRATLHRKLKEMNIDRKS